MSGVHARAEAPDDGDIHAALRGERAARAFLDRFRFPSGFVCRGCGAMGQPWEGPSGLLACRGCARPTPTTEGTPFDGPHPLRWWLGALWKATDGTAWTAAAIAEAIDAPLAIAETIQDRVVAFWRNSEPLYGVVFVDRLHVAETGTVGIAVELSAGARGRYRFDLIEETAASMTCFASRTVDPESIVIAPLDPIFAELAGAGFDLRQQSRLPRSRMVGTPRPDAIAESLRRHLTSTLLAPEDRRPVLEAFARTTSGRLDRNDRLHRWLLEMASPDPSR